MAEELYKDGRVNKLEKCVILLQMLPLWEMIYMMKKKALSWNCDRSEAENFLINNASYIEY